MPIDTTWLYSIPLLLVSIGALFVVVGLLDARSRARRLRRFEVWSFKPIPRKLLLQSRERN
jgi:hypothetical protein